MDLYNEGGDTRATTLALSGKASQKGESEFATIWFGAQLLLIALALFSV